MDLDETWQVGLRREKTHKPCTFPAKSHYGFRRAREKMGRRGVVFCDVYDAPLLPLSLDRFPQNIPRTRVQMVTSAEGCTVLYLYACESHHISNWDTWMGTQLRHQARGGTLLKFQ